MIAPGDLAALRIGCVKYLNARPLIYGCELPVRFDHPSTLASALARGQLDVALVPVFELFARPGYRVVDHVSISSRGPVLSVFLAYQGRLADVRDVSLDPASLTSAHLLRCLLAEFHGLHPIYSTEPPAKDDARLLIGNQALEFREKHGSEFDYLDLGEDWTARTGLPFVYALWLVRKEAAHLEAIGEFFRTLKCRGIAHICDIAQEAGSHSPEFRETYLRKHISFDLGEAEKQGMERFRTMLVKYGFARAALAACDYI